MPQDSEYHRYIKKLRDENTPLNEFMIRGIGYNIGNDKYRYHQIPKKVDNDNNLKLNGKSFYVKLSPKTSPRSNSPININSQSPNLKPVEVDNINIVKIPPPKDTYFNTKKHNIVESFALEPVKLNEIGNFPQYEIISNLNSVPRAPKNPFPIRNVRFNKKNARHLMQYIFFHIDHH